MFDLRLTHQEAQRRIEELKREIALANSFLPPHPEKEPATPPWRVSLRGRNLGKLRDTKYEAPNERLK